MGLLRMSFLETATSLPKRLVAHIPKKSNNVLPILEILSSDWFGFDQAIYLYRFISETVED